MSINENEVELDDPPRYTSQLRRELQNCVRLKTTSLPKLMGALNTTSTAPPHISPIQDIRCTWLEWFRREHASKRTIPVVDIAEISVSDFYQQFQMGNLPCKVLGLDRHEFKAVATLWVNEIGEINRDWFVSTLGEEILVPVRKESSGKMDEDGRAEECEVVDCPLKSWISSELSSQLYLKDWHLMHYLQNNGEKDDLYILPEIFLNDLLNRFLSRINGGDYKFVYWGPKDSKTLLHSDVLNSFSWSYNVVGKKEWKFYPPDDCIPIVIHQEAGECIFVPSGWKHEVTNIVETLSINHNWITSAMTDKLLDCILVEIEAIEKECLEWSMPIDDFYARESMLRGCAGLDVSSCLFLLVSSILELRVSSSSFHVDAIMLCGTLKSLLKRKYELNLQQRLSSMLFNDELALLAINTAEDVLNAFVIAEQKCDKEHL
jgi:JmjC domain, hydroxylase